MDVKQLEQDVQDGRVEPGHLVQLLAAQQRLLGEAHARIRSLEATIEELGKRLPASPTVKLDEPFSVKAEEKRQEAERRKANKKKRKKQKSRRRGRLSTAEKLALAEKEEAVYPEGVDPQQCTFSHSRPVWRLIDGRAVLVAYHVYRAPRSEYGRIAGTLGRSDAGRAGKVAALDERIIELCGPIWFAQLPPSEGPDDDYRLLCNELMHLMRQEQLFTFVTAAAVESPLGETKPESGTNNEAERGLRSPAMACPTGRTNKTVRGARRQTVLNSVLESLRLYLASFTLTKVVEEVTRWVVCGRSCFADLLRELKLTCPDKSILDTLLPVPAD